MAHLLSFAALVLVTLAVPLEPVGAQIRVTVRGRVIDAATRDPIDGARVLTPDSSSFVFTDSLGDFTLRIPIGLPLAIHVDQLGYFSPGFDLGKDAVVNPSVLRLEPKSDRARGVRGR